jgi:hypothetical protein
MRNTSWLCCAVCCALLVTIGPAFAVPLQEEQMEQGEQMEMSAEDAAMMQAMMESMTPGPEHAALAERAGVYTMNVTMWDPSAPEPETLTGTAERTMMFGGRVLQEKVKAEIMGMPFEGEARTGYDNVTDTYWSTWMDNMSTGLSSSTGKRLEDGSLELVGEVPNPMEGSMTRQKIVIHRDDDGSEVQTMYDERDGEWVKSMEIVYTKQ